MTDDIVERLRAEAANWSATCGDLFDEAADEIERLRGFAQWVTDQIDNEDADLDDIIVRAHRALKGE